MFDVVARFAGHLQRVQHTGQAALLRVHQVDEALADARLQVLAEAGWELRRADIMMRAHNDDRGVGRPGLNVYQPLLYFIDAFFPVRNAPKDQVETASGEEILVGGVVLLLSPKVPGAEHNRAKGVLTLGPLLVGPVANVDADRAHADPLAAFHGHAPVAHASGPVLRLSRPPVIN